MVEGLKLLTGNADTTPSFRSTADILLRKAGVREVGTRSVVAHIQKRGEVLVPASPSVPAKVLEDRDSNDSKEHPSHG